RRTVIPASAAVAARSHRYIEDCCMNFDHKTLGQRVMFGSYQAAKNLQQVVTERDAQTVMLIASNSQVHTARELAAGIDVALEYSEVVMHVPIETAENARAAAEQHKIDLMVAV